MFFAAAIYAVTTLFIFLFFKYEYSIGGSLVLCAVALYLVPLAQRHNDLIPLFARIFYMLAGILGLNFLWYVETNWQSIFGIWGTAFILSHWTSFWLWAIVTLPFLFSEDKEEDVAMFKRLKKIVLLSVICFGVFFPLLNNGIVLGIREHEPVFYGRHDFLRVSFVTTTWIASCAGVIRVYLKDIKDSELKQIPLRPELRGLRTGVMRIRSVFWYVYLAMIGIGSGIEIIRGQWLLWAASIACVGLMSLAVWEIYRPILTVSAPDQL